MLMLSFIIKRFGQLLMNTDFIQDKKQHRFLRLAKLPDFLTEGEDEHVWYFDHTSGKVNIQKNVLGTNFNIDDSIQKLDWKITNEHKIIAGFDCRKAVTVIFDSVYVFAFYTDEIAISGGPCSLHGLPGMILGVTIPRLYTSWIATKVSVNNVNSSIIKAVFAKKYYTPSSVKSIVIDRTKDWWQGDTITDEEKQQKNRFIWSVLL